MDAATSAAAAAWVAAGAAILFGLTGFVVGIVGNVRAGKATSAAAGANLIAKDANKIAKGANDLAIQANTLSSESNSIAREANDIAHAGHRRTIEQHDVTWDCNWRAAAVYAVRNEGKDTATSVRIAITVDDETVEVNRDSMAGGEEVLLKFPGAYASLQRERREEEEREVRARNALIVLPPIFPRHVIRDRVLWRTELGTPKEYDKTFPNCGLEP